MIEEIASMVSAEQFKEAIRKELIASYGKGSDMYWIVLGIVQCAIEKASSLKQDD